VFVTPLRTAAAGLLLAALAPGGASAPVPADRAKAEKELAAVAAKLHGSWAGPPCEGRLTFHANRTYEWTDRGPAGKRDKGVWTLGGDPAQPTLVLECKSSAEPDLVGKAAEVKLVRLDEETLAFKEPGAKKPKTFERAEKDSPAP
jgi:hypothetical protein